MPQRLRWVVAVVDVSFGMAAHALAVIVDHFLCASAEVVHDINLVGHVECLGVVVIKIQDAVSGRYE